jgi:hypothetical protein
MTFNDEEHQNRIKRFGDLWDSLIPLSKLTEEEFGIDDIFQDNEGKVAQQLTILGFENVIGREGNDGRDTYGVEWEMKSVNINKVNGVSTHHHLNHRILEKYRKVPWSFSIYKGVQLIEIYVVHPKDLEKEYFSKWQEELESDENKTHLNNKKININFVKEIGIKVYDGEHKLLLTNPTTIYDETFKQENLNYSFTEELQSYKEIAEEFINNTVKALDENIDIKTNEEQGLYECLINEKAFLGIKVKEKEIVFYLYLPDTIYTVSNKFKKYAKLQKGLIVYGNNGEYTSSYKYSSRTQSFDDISHLVNESFKYTLEKKSPPFTLF